MSLKALITCLLLVFVSTKPSDVTFKNVVVQGFSMYTAKFNITIKSSQTLKEHLTNKIFDKLEINNQNIPVLYKKSISGIDNLDELILDNDGIQEIQAGVFENVPQLRKLVIKNNNELETIKSGVLNNLNIAMLDLSRNSINTISSGAFDNMPELLSISLADNKLKNWNKNWFANTPSLIRVSFQNNLLEEIPAGAFVNLQGPKQIIEYNTTISIVLSNNKIKTIDKDAFKGLENINNIWIDGNQIEALDENLWSNIKLKTLRVDNNKIRCLDGDFEKFFNADTIHIDGNPWDCECLKGIGSWARKQGKNVVMFYSKMTCDAERIDKKIKQLNRYLKDLKDNSPTKEEK